MRTKLKNFLFRNVTASQTLAKNAFWLGFSNIAGRLLRATIIIYAARVLGAAEWGAFSYAISLVAFLTVFADLGMNNILTRETARGQLTLPKKEIMSTAFYIKLALLALGISLVVFFAPRLTNLPKADKILPIVALVLAFDTMRDFGSALARAFEKMEWEAGLFILTNAAIVVFGFAFLLRSPTVESFSVAYAAGAGAGMIATFWVLRRKFAGLLSGFSRKLVLPLVTAAWPIALSGILGGLMLNTDVLILGWFRSAEEVGFYAAAQRIVQLLYAIPIVLAVAAFPIFSRLARREDAKAKRILEMVLSFSLLLALPLAAGGLILDKAIMEFVFGGQYVQAALPFGLLSLTLIPIFPSIILSNTVFAYGAQRKLAVFTAIGGIANVLLDLVFIPPWGAAGSAAATILSQVLAITYLYRSAQESLRFELWRHIKKILAATALMGLFVYWLFSASGLSVLWIVCAGATLYAILLYAFKEPVLEKTRLILSNSLIGAENDLL